MNKTELLALLATNGIEANDSMTVAALKELAESKGLSTAKAKPVRTKAAAPGDDYYAALQQSKVAAGLPLGDAIEVTARQRKEDEASGFTLETPSEEALEA